MENGPDDIKNSADVTENLKDDKKSRADNAKKQRRELIRALSSLSQVGITMVVCVLIGVFLGKFLDDRLGTAPWLLLVCSLLGVAAAIKSIYDMSTRG